ACPRRIERVEVVATRAGARRVCDPFATCQHPRLALFTDQRVALLALVVRLSEAIVSEARPHQMLPVFALGARHVEVPLVTLEERLLNSRLALLAWRAGEHDLA